MKIEAVKADSSGGSVESNTDVVVLKISGPVDPENPILRRARELVRGTESQRMINSFEAAVKSGAFSFDE